MAKKQRGMGNTAAEQPHSEREREALHGGPTKYARGAVDRAQTSQPLDANPASAQAFVPSVQLPARPGWLRYDRPGHIDERHAQRLLRLSGQRRDDDSAFLFENSQDDELATELAEHAVQAMTAGGDSLLDSRDEAVDEEQGGPFLETRASQEFARGGARATAGFFREALPTSGPELEVMPRPLRARKG